MDGANQRLKLFKADLLVDGSFDDAILGVDGVFHTASPVFLPTQSDDVPTMLVDSCIKGTLNVLNSCIKASSVKRVVMTGSASALRYRDDVQQVSPLNESHWSDPEYCKRYGLWYPYSKTLAEKAAWEIAANNGLDLVVVNPSYVVGPVLTPQPTSSLLFLLMLIKGVKGDYPRQVIGFVHIDDVIAAHILAMEEKKASGRLICSSDVAHWSDIMEMLKAKYPMYPFESKLSSQEGDDNPHSMDTNKIMGLGFPGFKTIPQMFDDCIKSFQDKGFLQAERQNEGKRRDQIGMAVYCVTGGTGFIASHLVKALLEKGHAVRATVRDPEDDEKVGFLWEMNGAAERLKLYKADLTVDESFDEVFQGVDGVFHVACPVVSPRDTDDVQTLIVDPCVSGTLNVLDSCSKASTVKRVVLTSSCYAIKQRDDIQLISPLNETHWSDFDYCKRHNMWYAYAKTLAEKMAWEIAGEKGLDLVVVHPSFVVGPLLSPHPSSTIKFLLDLIKGKHGGYQNRYVGFVHVEDVVGAHILAMEESNASGRLICSSSVAHWSDIIAMLKDKYPQYPFESNPISKEEDGKEHSMDTSKIMKLGFPGFKTIPQMFDDCIKSLQVKGLLQSPNNN